jgi:hypothetical protein
LGILISEKINKKYKKRVPNIPFMQQLIEEYLQIRSRILPKRDPTHNLSPPPWVDYQKEVCLQLIKLKIQNDYVNDEHEWHFNQIKV